MHMLLLWTILTTGFSLFRQFDDVIALEMLETKEGEVSRREPLLCNGRSSGRCVAGGCGDSSGGGLGSHGLRYSQRRGAERCREICYLDPVNTNTKQYVVHLSLSDMHCHAQIPRSTSQILGTG